MIIYFSSSPFIELGVVVSCGKIDYDYDAVFYIVM